MIAGVVLAAGASKRMGRDKALEPSGGASFLVQGVRHLWAACDSVVVVLGAHAPSIRAQAEAEFERLVGDGRLDAELRAAAQRQGGAGLEAHFLVNPRWKLGMLESARAGLRDALRLKPACLLVLPVDHPMVKPVTVASLSNVVLQAIAACRPRERGAFSYALVPRYRRRRGHPLALSPALAAAVAADNGAEDLSDAVRRNARLIGYLDVGDSGVVTNRNTPRG